MSPFDDPARDDDWTSEPPPGSEDAHRDPMSPTFPFEAPADALDSATSAPAPAPAQNGAGSPHLDTDTADGDGKPRRKQEIAREIVLELQAMRGGLEELVQAYTARVDGQIATAARQLEQGVMGESERELPSTKSLNKLLRELRDTKLKPRKGRAKDLKRMENVADALSELTGPD